ncbi:hypothetical protein GCM10022281_19370 [Sphingomonas rosea]|uniref:Outer membrane protein beta-barrel domain-containing protein n=1 Tax=Sphingomonas rosea TaxID=335605 RepID=A0ABP7U9S7_9SPHN
MKKIWAILPVAIATVATPAFAQSTSPSINFRAEVRGGYDEARTKLELSQTASTQPIVLSPATGAQTRRFSANDISVGFEAGVDGKIGEGAVVGLYAGLDTSNVDECRTKVFGTTYADKACTKLGTSWDAGVRAGIATGDGGLIYVKGGYTKGRVRTSYTNRPFAATPTTPAIPATQLFSVSENLGGYHVGGGFELNLGKTIYAKGEYVRTVFDRGYKNVIIAPNNIDVRRNQIVFGLGIRFGSGL